MSPEEKFIERFCDKYSPDTKGEQLVTRIDDIDNRIKNLFLGIGALYDKANYEWSSVLGEYNGRKR
jgi:hypothetical protein